MKHIKPFNESILSREEIANICNSLAYNHNYISSYGIPRGSWTINSDGLVDVYDNVNLYNLRLTKLPVRFGRIEYTSNGNTQKGSYFKKHQ